MKAHIHAYFKNSEKEHSLKYRVAIFCDANIDIKIRNIFSGKFYLNSSNNKKKVIKLCKTHF